MDIALERLVWQRAKSRCEYCQLPQAFSPELGGGGEYLDKLATPCQKWHTMSSDATDPTKALVWIGSSLKDLKAFPSGARHRAGFAL